MSILKFYKNLSILHSFFCWRHVISFVFIIHRKYFLPCRQSNETVYKNTSYGLHRNQNWSLLFLTGTSLYEVALQLLDWKPPVPVYKLINSGSRNRVGKGQDTCRNLSNLMRPTAVIYFLACFAEGWGVYHPLMQYSSSSHQLYVAKKNISHCAVTFNMQN